MSLRKAATKFSWTDFGGIDTDTPRRYVPAYNFPAIDMLSDTISQITFAKTKPKASDSARFSRTLCAL